MITSTTASRLKSLRAKANLKIEQRLRAIEQHLKLKPIDEDQSRRSLVIGDRSSLEHIATSEIGHVAHSLSLLARRRRSLAPHRRSLISRHYLSLSLQASLLRCSLKQIRVDFNLENLPSDPWLREKISSYHPNNYDEIRRYYLQKGPCQLVFQHHDDYPLSYFSRKPRRFRFEWYVNRKWLEYSIDKDAVSCFYCYLFGQDVGEQGGAFRGHDESQGSSDKRNFLELLQFSGDHNESINDVLQKVPKNCKLTHHNIQKDIVNAITRETSKAIIKDLDNGFFLILVDESRDISVKEQMALVLHYVNKKGIIIERFLGIVHVANTTALSLKYAIECLLCEHNLNLSKLHRQGYDGASNMQGDINGVKTLILKENMSAFYVHCFGP
ncbi:hypothetical protein SO802_015262 [Lithocarpus litseifolius]|uniref:DUF4371 domain-containing protein n=1 Tax=Lithocarpus litseifolius TaxID=425828 RepID=A0AAW2CTQ9_9ROSI